MCCSYSRGYSNGSQLYRSDTSYQSVSAYLFCRQAEVIRSQLFCLKWSPKLNTGSLCRSSEHLSQTNTWLIWIFNTFWLHRFPIISSSPVRASSAIPHLPLLVIFDLLEENVLHKCRLAAKVPYRKERKKKRKSTEAIRLVMNSQLFELFLAGRGGDKYG